GGATWQASPVFSGLAGGREYCVLVKNKYGCISDKCCIYVNPVPAKPAKPALTAKHPTCETPYGVVTVTAPLGAYYTYSIDGGATWQASPVFSGLAGGREYCVLVKNKYGCISDKCCIYVNPVPPTPGKPYAQNDERCGPGQVTLRASGCEGGRLLWYATATGGSPIFEGPIYTPNLTATTTFYVSCIIGKCEGARTPVTGTIYPVPTVGVVASPSRCVGTTPTVTITASPTGGLAPYTYVWTVPAGAANPGNVASFDATVAGRYSVVVTDYRGCMGTGYVTPVFIPCRPLEGCTPGYWKQAHHFGNWGCGYDPTGADATLFFDVFDVSNFRGLDEDLTLLEALNLGGGGFNALARHAAAALLNACDPADVNYTYTTAQVEAMVEGAFASGNPTAVHSDLERANERGCPLGRAELASTSVSSLQGVETLEGTQLTAYPTPFADKATIEFRFAKDENYTINLYDMKGSVVKQLKAGTARAGEVNQVEVDGRDLPEGLYIGRMMSDSGVKTVKLLLKKQ
ncbi:T9SS type A sorting domain-containing protein, partial [Pontibacter toksunensis]